jgi:type VI secretion system protein ImpM
MSSPPNGTGLFGKIPSRGDFIQKNLPVGFLKPWDTWLQAALNQSRADLGDRWLETFLSAPVWCFFLAPDVCGAKAAAGIMLPSVDSVGRYFPLTLVAATTSQPLFPPTSATKNGWYAAAADIALDYLHPKANLDELEQRLILLGAPEEDPVPTAHNPLNSEVTAEDDSVAIEVLRLHPSEMSAATFVDEVYSVTLDHIRRMAYRRYTFWWTEGGEFVPPSAVLYSGLPPATAFASFLNAVVASTDGK